MSLPFETRTYHLRGLTPLMGGQPASAEIRSKWIGSKAPTPELIEAEAEAKLPCVDEEQGFTVFCRDPKNGNLTLMDYQVRGLIKGCLEGMQGVNGIAQPRAKVDKYVMVLERYIPLTRGGEPIYGEDAINERPLRAKTMQGERNALAASELIEDWECEFTIMLIPNNGTKSSKKVTWAAIEQGLDYGAYQGLGQWRNGGYGKFEWTMVNCDPGKFKAEAEE